MQTHNEYTDIKPSNLTRSVVYGLYYAQAGQQD